MSRVLSFLLLLTFAIGGISSNGAFLIGARAEPEPNISSKKTLVPAERIRHVERGLLLPIVIAGQPSLPMALVDRMEFYKTPAVSIAVINNGKLEWARGYGVREAGKKEPVTTETLFQAGSISKPVTAVAALLMVERKQVSLDEDVNKKLASWKVPENEFTREKKVSLRNLLTHSGGLTNHAVGNYYSGDQLPALLEILDGKAPAKSPPIRVGFVPGSRWDYSGGGYTVLQQLLIDVSGKQFAELLKESVLDPLKMKHSTFQQPLPKDLWPVPAVGHARDGQKIKGDWVTFPEMAAAGLWSTPSDLARFAIELQRSQSGRSNRILSIEMTRQMLSRQIGSWGLGLEVEGEGHSARFNHGGDTEGYKCLMVAYENTGQGAVIMTNSDRGDRLAGEILRSIAKEYGWTDYQPKVKVIASVDPKTWDVYVGQYQLDISSAIVVSIISEGDKLIMELKQPSGVSKAELLPESSNKFFRGEIDFDITFVRNEKGRVTELIMRQEGEPSQKNRIVERMD
jgi:CubicO group peptidase (beta-lactamase class C family)